jgi:hypothetical protein
MLHGLDLDFKSTLYRKRDFQGVWTIRQRCDEFFAKQVAVSLKTGHLGNGTRTPVSLATSYNCLPKILLGVDD